MGLTWTILLFLSLAGAAEEQSFPVGVGVIATKEKLKVGGGCNSSNIEGSIWFATYANGTWAADTDSGLYTGSLSPADSKGRSWNLEFDGSSLLQYESYLEFVASMLCGTEVAILDGSIDAFVIKFGKDETQVSLQLKTSATGMTIFGSGKGKHSVKGKGAFAPGI
jgi:hypothetical protein